MAKKPKENERPEEEFEDRESERQRLKEEKKRLKAEQKQNKKPGKFPTRKRNWTASREGFRYFW